MQVSDKPLVNRVAASSLETINLEEFFPKASLLSFDLKDFLFREMILKEKDFRESLKQIDWSKYEGTVLCVHCSTDAIIPVWAYMLVASYAQPVCTDVFSGTTDEYIRFHFDRVLDQFDASAYKDKKIVIKGCSNKPVPASAYLALTRILRPFASSIMYGEPCSTVPIFKK